MEWKFVVAAVLLVASVKTEDNVTDSTVRLCIPESLYHGCLQMADDVDGVQCVKARDRQGCMKLVQTGEADVVNLDGQEIYVGGQYFDLSVAAYEAVDGDPFKYEAVALVSINTNISSLADLQNKRSCHTGLGRNAGWQIPVAQLLKSGVMTPDCRGELYTVSGFFSSSCASGNWSPDSIVDTELKKRHPSLCAQCQHPEPCSVENELYNGYEGAIQCLLDDAGDVAFTSMRAARDFLLQDSDAENKLQLLCLDGSKKSVQDSEPCIWGRRPTNAFLISSATDEENRSRIVNFLLSVFARYPPPHVRRPDWFNGVLVSKKATSLQEAQEDQRSWKGYLGDFLYTIDKHRDNCEEQIVKFCVTSDVGRDKCEDFAKVARSVRLTPLVECVQTQGKTECMQALKDGNADIFTLDGGDVYKGGRYYDLKPVVAELYGETDASYFSVAIVRANSSITKIQDLRGLKSCHTGIGRTAGWVVPIGALVRAGEIGKSQACYATEAVANYFSGGSCVPGANDPKLNPNTPHKDELCQQCIGDENGENKCQGSAERYSGYSGAFRCLAETKGDVAFVKHTTVQQYTDGRSDLPWARDLKASDFWLVCPDNAVADVNDYINCNLAKVPSHYVMLTGNATEEFQLEVARLLTGASKYLGPNSLRFKLFGAYSSATDLLFKDSTTNVRAVPLQETYENVLGSDYFSAVEAVDPKRCGS